MTEINCDCDCHYADSGGLVCSRCWRDHERQVAKDIPVILREFARELANEDDANESPRQ